MVSCRRLGYAPDAIFGTFHAIDGARQYARVSCLKNGPETQLTRIRLRARVRFESNDAFIPRAHLYAVEAHSGQGNQAGNLCAIRHRASLGVFKEYCKNTRRRWTRLKALGTRREFETLTLCCG